MTKAELRAAIEAKGIMMTTKSHDPLWKQAFDLYNSTNKDKKNINCGGCWGMVRAWLQN